MTWMSWKCAFQARASVAFRAVQFQLNSQSFVLFSLPPSLAISVRTERAATDCRNYSSMLCTRKSWEKAEGSNYYIIFLFVLFACLLFFWEISRSHNWQERKAALCYWKWCWLTLEVTKKVQEKLEVLAYPPYFQTEFVFELVHGRTW